MRSRKPKILVVEPDAEIVEILVDAFSRRFDAHITCVRHPIDGLEIEFGDPADLVIAEMRLPEMEGLAFAEQVLSVGGGERPVVLMADNPSAREVIRAMRLGVRDVFRKPFPLKRLLKRAEHLLTEYEKRRQHLAKYHRMRELVRFVIRERRELARRTEFICRDLVGAHRRLVNRVLEHEESQARP